jgi:hypothetical protein
MCATKYGGKNYCLSLILTFSLKGRRDYFNPLSLGGERGI